MHVAYLLNTGGHARRHREAFARIFDSDLEPNRKYLGFSLFAMEFRNLSLSLSLSIYQRDRAREREIERERKRVGVQRRRISRVETSSSPLCRDDGDPETWITVAGGPGRAE